MSFFKKKDKAPSTTQPVDESANTHKKEGFFKKKSKTNNTKKQKVSPQDRTIAIQLDDKNSQEAWMMAHILANTERDRAMKLLKITLTTTMLLSFLLSVVFYWAVFYKKDIYFAAKNDGTLQEIVPNNEEYLSIAGISNWTTRAITETFTLSFHNYKLELSQIQHYYTDDAWIKLDRELRPIINAIVKNRMFVVAVADEAPRIIHKGVMGKKYAWRLQFPLTLTHQMPETTRTYRWNVDVIVQRANPAEKSDAVEITKFVITSR